MIRNKICSLPSGFQLSSDNEELQQAILYSRALYNLQDISSFTGMENIISDEEKEEEEEEDDEIKIMSLSEYQVDSLINLFNSNKQCWLNMFTSESFGKAISSIIEEVQVEEDILPCISPIHVETIRRMCEELQNNSHSHINKYSPPKLLIWENIKAGYYYQLACRLFLEIMDDTGIIISEKPQSYYDGYLFHSILNDVIAEFDEDNYDGCVHDVAKINRFIAEGVGERENEKSENASETFNDVLPIDEHMNDILHKIDTNRVTIIQGETGCGKSSRLPVMLLEQNDKLGRLKKKLQIYISQPRRIAVMGLLKRLRPLLGKRVGMKMGQGIYIYIYIYILLCL